MASIRSGIGENMEDRYLFKGKRIDNGEWVQGYLFDDGFENGRMFVGGLVIEEYHGTACDDWSITGINFCEVDPSTICQCTGLKDKNGNLIWENDIIERLDIHDIKEPSIGIIEYDVENTSFLIHWTDIANYSPTFHWKNRIGVAGNIFDNPELLEVSE